MNIVHNYCFYFAFVPVENAPTNPNNSIVIRNVDPKSWTGRKFDVGVYKANRLLTVERGVNISSQVDFELQPKLYFAVVRNFVVGKIFTMDQITSHMELFDLSKFPDGIVVTLTQEPVGGKYTFSAAQMS